MDLSATRKPDLKTEAIAGITTFFTMAYIVVVNPQILSADGKTGMAFTGVLTATMLVCFTMTLLMGMYAKLPFAVAPGMGINAFLHDHSGQGSAMANSTGNHLLGGCFLSADLSDTGARIDRESNSQRDKNRGRRRHRHLSYFHRLTKRRLHRFGSGDLRKTWRVG